MRLGIDWGGTKIEIIAQDETGNILLRERIPTPADYGQCIDAVTQLVETSEQSIGQSGTLGIGIPGSISPGTGLVKNANSTWLNGKPLLEDLQNRLNREVRIQNDANCFAVSEAIDGAGVGHHLVAGVIIGTGCGCGLAIDGVAHAGRNGIAGEFGHVPLGWCKEDEYPGEQCWCGRLGCNETWISGTAFQKDYRRISGETDLRSGSEIIALDTPESRKAFDNYTSRLARALAILVNMVDPDVIVLGGGMSRVTQLYEDLPGLVEPHIFSDTVDISIVPPKHGDSSGVRGAAWLW